MGPRGCAVLLLVGWIVFGSAAAKGQPKELIEGAKKEGQLVFYSGIPVPDGKAIMEAFQRKYPFIKGTHYRAAGTALTARIQSERRAGQHLWDVLNTSGFEPYVLLEQGYFAKYDSPERKHYAEGYRDAEAYWTTMYTTPMMVSYNTRLVSPEELPKDYLQLLDSKWKGKLALDSREFEWYANLKKVWGADKSRKFLEGLRKQDVRLMQGRALLTELLAGGEFAILVNSYLQDVIEAKRKGSPVEILSLDPVISAAGLVGINNLAPHPNAARLFIDFTLSKEGQELIVKTDRSSVRKDISRNPMDMIENVRVIPSDLTLAKDYQQSSDEYRELLGIK
jgi:ABC-type Fe3+ transport system substrate-binding protein